MPRVLAVVTAAVAAITTQGCCHCRRGTLYRAASCGAVQITGTFSSLAAVPDQSLALVGAEVRVVSTGRGRFATLQLSESDGSLSKPVVCELHDKYEGWPLGVPYPEGVSGSQSEMWCDLPEPRAGRLECVITPVGFKGLIVFRSGGNLQLDLPRREGFWE